MQEHMHYVTYYHLNRFVPMSRLETVEDLAVDSALVGWSYEESSETVNAFTIDSHSKNDRLETAKKLMPYLREELDTVTFSDQMY